MFHGIVTLMSIVALNRERIENLERTVAEFNVTTQELHGRIEYLEREVARMNASLTGSSNQTITKGMTTTMSTMTMSDIVCDEGMVYRGKCYYAIIHDDRDVVLSEGNASCRESGGRLADVLNLEHQVLVENYARQKKEETGVIFLWLGMKYETSTKTVRGSNGMSWSISSFRWHDGYPQWQSNMGISIEAATSLYGLFTTAENKLHGSLCEK